MWLGDLKRQDSLLYMERYVNEGAKTYSVLASRTEAEPRYRPESEETFFELVSVVIPPDQVAICQAETQAGLAEQYLTARGVVFPIHPETWARSDSQDLNLIHSMPQGPNIPAAPTASTRTVFVLTPGKTPAHFIKLHYPFFISRFRRRLRLKEIRNAVAATHELSLLRSSRFAYMPESFGVIYGKGEEGWGYLLREATPRPVVEGRFLIPCFSLYAGDRRDPQSPPLLVQMIDHLQVEPAAFTVKEILGPILECWSQVARERGLLLQSHAQNVLLEVDEDFRPRRVVHRDFDVWVDLEVREEARLPNPFVDTDRLPDKVHPIRQFYSLIYDGFMGHGFFEYLLRLLVLHYGVDAEAVRRAVRALFHAAFPDSERFFPANTTFYFSEATPPNRDYDLEDMRQAPVWR